MPTKVESGAALTFPAPPELPQEQPIDATTRADRYAVLHTGVEEYAYLDLVPGDRFPAPAIARLLSLGAMAPVADAIVRLDILGRSADAQALRTKAAR